MNYDEFQFDRSSLTRPRKPGISAYMRIKNEEQFLRLSILSHLDFYDEIVAVYNDCTDATPEILRELAAQHPQKIKVYHYLPKVHPVRSVEHAQTSDDSVHGSANYYNYALSKTNYTVAVKLDADHIAIPQNLAPLIRRVRADIAAGNEMSYIFSGINLMCNSTGEIGVNETWALAGGGDHMYHMVTADSYYVNVRLYQSFNPLKKWKPRYMGIMYFHLKHLKPDFGYGSHDAVTKERRKREFVETNRFISFEEFCTRQCHARLAKKLPARHRFLLRTHFLFPRENYVRYKLATMQLVQLKSDLQNINFRRDVIDLLQDSR